MEQVHYGICELGQLETFSDANDGIFHKIKVSDMVSHPLTPCVTRSSAVLVLTIQNESLPSMRKEFSCLRHFGVDEIQKNDADIFLQTRAYRTIYTHIYVYIYKYIYIFWHTANMSHILHRYTSCNKFVMYGIHVRTEPNTETFLVTNMKYPCDNYTFEIRVK